MPVHRIRNGELLSKADSWIFEFFCVSEIAFLALVWLVLDAPVPIFGLLVTLLYPRKRLMSDVDDFDRR